MRMNSDTRSGRFQIYFEQFSSLAMWRTDIGSFNADRALIDVSMYISDKQRDFLRTELSHYRNGRIYTC